MSTEKSRRLWAIARAAHMDVTAGELFGALAADGVDALLVRGPAIACRLYDNGERSYGDCDVLVPEERREAVERTLRGLGYAPSTALGLARLWRRARDRAQVDLHVSLWGVHAPSPVLWEALARNRVTFELGRSTVPVPGPAATALVVALHASQHGGTVGHPLEDLRRALERLGPDVWADAVERARESESLHAFRQGLSMLPAGAAHLDALGLEPVLSWQAALRRDGTRIPDYLFEGISPSERIGFLRRRFAPGLEAAAAPVDRRPAAARAHRLAHVTADLGRLARPWWQARRATRAANRPRESG